jgi:hypothetical protein
VILIKIILLALSLVPPLWAATGHDVRTVKLCEKSVAQAFISPKGTVLDFPAEPEKVILGTKGSFFIEYIRNDLAISPATLGAKSNLFVYLQGRRFALDLSASSTNGATLYFIKDCLDDKIMVKKRGR